MEEKEKATAVAKESQGKGSAFSLKSKVLSVLKSNKSTAIELNRMFHFNDSRKVISDLRKSGYPISDYILENRQKVYFLQKSPQLELFRKGGES